MGQTTVNIQYVGVVRRSVGVKMETLVLHERKTLGAVFDQLAQRHGPEFRRLVLDGEQLSRSSSVMVDGRNCLSLGGINTVIGDASEIEIVVFGPPAMGG